MSKTKQMLESQKKYKFRAYSLELILKKDLELGGLLSLANLHKDNL